LFGVVVGVEVALELLKQPPSTTARTASTTPTGRTDRSAALVTNENATGGDIWSFSGRAVVCSGLGS